MASSGLVRVAAVVALGVWIVATAGRARAATDGGVAEGTPDAAGVADGGAPDGGVPPVEREPTAEELEKLAVEQVIQVEDVAPPREPFAPDTTTRLSGKQLAERGVTTLAQALQQIPEVSIRPGGRGDQRIQVRGGRKGSVLLVLDGVPINEAYYGTFDPSSIPVTDIAEIRVSLSAASPLDGPGGPAGVIEIVTVNPRGPRRIAATAIGSTAPGFLGGATLRLPLGDEWGLRLSAGSQADFRGLELIGLDGGTRKIDQSSRFFHGAGAVGGEVGKLRLFSQVIASRRVFLVPPSDSPGSQVQVVDGETMIAGQARAELEAAGFLVGVSGYGQWVDRRIKRFADAALATFGGEELVSANSAGVRARLTRAIGQGLDLVGLAALHTERATDVDDLQMKSGGSTYLTQWSAGAEWKPGAGLRGVLAAGLAVPLTAGDSPWPEAKLTVRWKPFEELELSLVGARKGRVPTLRERYGRLEGNRAIRPEMVTAAELGLRARPVTLVEVSANGYLRRTDGFIRFNDARTQQVNYADFLTSGLESRMTIGLGQPVSLTGMYQLTRVDTLTGGAEPLENVPSHRVDVWLDGHLGERAGAWLTARWLGERTDGGTKLPAYVDTEGAAWVRIVPALRATARVTNALGDRWRDRADTPSLGRTAYLGLDGVW